MIFHLHKFWKSLYMLETIEQVSLLSSWTARFFKFFMVFVQYETSKSQSQSLIKPLLKSI